MKENLKKKKLRSSICVPLQQAACNIKLPEPKGLVPLPGAEPNNYTSQLHNLLPYD
jgi:hypothetical protein